MPDGTKELAIFIGRFRYEKVGGTRKLVVPFGDLVTHIKPSLHKIAANTMPPKSAWSAFGTISCPTKREGQNIVLELFALDRTKQFWELKNRLATRLTEEALDQGADSANTRSPGKLTQDALGVGRFTATYGP